MQGKLLYNTLQSFSMNSKRVCKEMLRVTIEYNELRAEFEGDYEDVWKGINEFLSKVRNIMSKTPVKEYIPIDYDLLKGVIEYGPKGPELFIEKKISQSNAILLALYAFGGKESADNILKAVTGWGIHFKGKKVFSARISDLKRAGLIDVEDSLLVLKLKGKKFVESLLGKLKGEE